MITLEHGRFLGRIPYARVGADPRPLLVLGGGQAFVQRPGPRRIARDARRIARLLPPGTGFLLLGYDPAPPPDHSLEAITTDLAQIIAELGGPVRMIGISYGGIVALALAAAHPALVSDLVLLVSAHDFSAEGRRRVQRQIEHAARRDLVALVSDFAMVFRRPWLNALLRLRLRRRRSRLATDLNDPEIIIRGLTAVASADLGDVARLGRVTARCLIVGGSQDQFFGDGRFEQTAAHLPDARLRLFGGETHMLPVERASEVAAELRGFLAR